MIHIGDIIINLIRKHLNQLNLYNLQFMRVGFNITAEVWNLTPNCWNSESIINIRQEPNTNSNDILYVSVCIEYTRLWNLGINL